MNKLIIALAIANLIAVSGCSKTKRKQYSAPEFGASITEPPTVSRPLTYHADVEPIVKGRCATCHVSGGTTTPFPLQSFSDVSTHASAIKAAVADRRMPPYSALNSCNEYSNDWSLTEDQRGVITSWVDQGAPEGPLALVSPIAPIKMGLSRTDLTIGIKAPYQPKPNTDDYHCFVLDWPETAPMFVTGFDVKPDNLAVVHHVLVFAVAPDQVAAAQALDDAEPGDGYTCFGGPGIGNGGLTLVGAWVPGAGGGDAPAGTGIPVAPGSKLIMQMHYNTYSAGATTPGKDKPDQTQMLLKVDPVVPKPAGTIAVVNPNWIQQPATMLIPAGQDKVIHSFELDPTLETKNQPFTLYRVALHQHRLGTKSRLTLIKKDKSEECLLDIARWDFNWQEYYELATPLTVEPGEAIRIECEWNNDVPGAHDVTWGEGTKDEMCLGGLYIAL